MVVVVAVRRNIFTSSALLYFAVLIPSVIVHEVSHGVVALGFGDDTAKRAGRLTLNPLAHVDPIGTIILPALLLLGGLGAFGYAKPVPIDPRRMRRPRNQAMLTSLAGPATNLLLAALAGIVYRATTSIGPLPGGAIPAPMWARLVYLLGFVNVVLAIFNLIPIPPLDGSAVVERVLPMSWWPRYLKLRALSLPILLGLVLLLPRVLGDIFAPALNLWNHLLG